MLRSAPGYRLPADCSVECNETPRERNRKARQIKIGKMPWACNQIEATRLQHTQRIGPEAVALHSNKFGEDGADPVCREPWEGIPGIAHDPETAVLRNGARRPTSSAIIFEPDVRRRVKFVRGIDQRDRAGPVSFVFI